MNRRKYDRLDYVGNARYIVIDIYPHKSEVKISANNPYVFDENDVLNQTAIDYYKSLYDYGVRLHEVDSADKKDETPVNTSTDNNSDIITKSANSTINNNNQLSINNVNITNPSTSYVAVNTSNSGTLNVSNSKITSPKPQRYYRNIRMRKYFCLPHFQMMNT